MKTVFVLILAAICMTGCTAREATTKTFGFLGAAIGGATGIDPVGLGQFAEDSAEIGFEAAKEMKEVREAKRAEELINGNSTVASDQTR